MFYNKNVYYLLCFFTNPVFGKIVVPEIWAKMFSANKIAGFLIRHISRTNQWNSLIFCMLIQIQIKSWSKKFWIGVARNGCGQSGQATLKLAVSKELIDGMNWFFAWWCKFRKAKSYFNWTDEITWILHASTNARRLKVYSVIFECALSKMAVAF